MVDQCDHYCQHGGWCILGKDHLEGLHSSGACTWFGWMSLTREEADKILAEKPGGLEYLAERDAASSGEW
jgi:uncharacterized Fe-S cluster protein YjdI